LATPSLQPPDVETMQAEDVLRWAYEEFGDRLCLTCSWQKQSSVLVHMVAQLELDIPVIELDTHLFFRESYETRDRLVERYGIRLLPPPPLITVAEQHRQEGPNLWETDPDRCCHVR
jgi:phosphoadenosine phosphosulfate reductase